MGNYTEIANIIVERYLSEYWRAISAQVSIDPTKANLFPFYLADPDEIILYLGKTHIAIEYVNNESKLTSTEVKIKLIDCLDQEDLFLSVVNIEYDGTSIHKFPLAGVVEHIFAPTLSADQVLTAAGWNLHAEFLHGSAALMFNSSGFQFVEGEFVSLRDCMFYGTNTSGLIVRHIKWIDVFPVAVTDTPVPGEKRIELTAWPSAMNLARLAVAYQPLELEESQLEKLVILNRFIELFNLAGIREQTLTDFLAKPENQFILKIAFNSTAIFAQVKLQWLSEPQREAIKPDFFVTQSDGFSNIVDFKLPTLKHSSIVGRENRETFNAEIHSYAAQMRTYVTFFEESRHRDHVEQSLGIKVRYPKAILVIGRRSMFNGQLLKEIENDYRNIEIKTYDDIVDLVRGIVYLIKF